MAAAVYTRTASAFVQRRVLLSHSPAISTASTAASRRVVTDRSWRSFSTRQLPPHVLMPMPRLSPTMENGTIDKWLVQQGEEIKACDLVCNVRTNQLLEDDQSEFIMEVEVHEDGWLAKTLVPKGGNAVPDQPIAIICEKPEDVDAFADFHPSVEERVPAGTFIWQAYKKDGPQSEGCG